MSDSDWVFQWERNQQARKQHKQTQSAAAAELQSTAETNRLLFEIHELLVDQNRLLVALVQALGANMPRDLGQPSGKTPAQRPTWKP